MTVFIFTAPNQLFKEESITFSDPRDFTISSYVVLQTPATSTPKYSARMTLFTFSKETVALAQGILALELGTYETWYGESDPTAYAELFADKATYIEPWSENRIEDSTVKEYMMTLAGQIPNLDYEILIPRVDLYGKTAVFTFVLEYSNPTSGAVLGLWKGTAVFTRTKDSWEKVHAHFSSNTMPP